MAHTWRVAQSTFGRHLALHGVPCRHRPVGSAGERDRWVAGGFGWAYVAAYQAPARDRRRRGVPLRRPTAPDRWGRHRRRPSAARRHPAAWSTPLATIRDRVGSDSRTALDV